VQNTGYRVSPINPLRWTDWVIAAYLFAWRKKMKRVTGLMLVFIFMSSAVALCNAGMFGKSDKEIEAEKFALISSFNDTLSLKDNQLAAKDTEIAQLKTDNERLSKELESINKKLSEAENNTVVYILPEDTQSQAGETRALRAIITQEITSYAKVFPAKEGCKIIFNTDFFYYFDIPEAVLYRALDVIVKTLKIYPDHQIIINGYTDSSGDEKANLQSSLNKARAIGNYFIAKGIPMGKISTLGLGWSNPIESNLSKEGRKENRRVEVIIK